MSSLVFFQHDAYPANGHSVRPHVHSCWELVYYMNSSGYTCLYGKNDDNIGNRFIRYLKTEKYEEKLEFSPNSLILYAPRIVHDEHIVPLPAGSEQVSQNVISFGFLPDEQLAPALSMGVYPDDGLVVYRLLKNLQSEYAHRSAYYESALDHLVSLILIEIVRQSNQAPKENDLKYILQFIDEYYTTHISVESLASMANYSLSQFRKLFHSKTGLSPKQYILKRRIDEAKYLLENSDFPLAEIAARCGYEDYNQFQVFFRKVTGVAPSEYHASLRS